MSLSNEWTDWHLTPRGWEIGSQRLDFGGIQHTEPPSDRVLTIKEREFVGAMGGKMNRSWEDQWKSDDAEAVKRLVAQFGAKPG